MAAAPRTVEQMKHTQPEREHKREREHRRAPGTARGTPIVSAVVVWTAVGAALVLGACAEDPLSLEPDDAPGAATITREEFLPAAELPDWRDTTISGFVRRTTASFVVVAIEEGFQSRTLMRFDVPDTIMTFADTLPVDHFDSASFTVSIDQAFSEFAEFPATFRLVGLAQAFDAETATWSEAGDSAAWAMPGGDLTTEIAAGELADEEGSVELTFSVDADSLLKSWQELDGGPGVALMFDGAEAFVRIPSVVLHIEPVLEGREVPVRQDLAPVDRTFITDPPFPPTGTELRVGGVPGSRAYFQFTMPDTIAGVPLRGSTVNHAELILQPLPAADSAWVVRQGLNVRQVALLADPWELGARTPVGASSAAGVRLTPDLLAESTPLTLNLTAIVANAAAGGPVTIRIGVRPDPVGQELGFVSFGSVESEGELAPVIRVVLSPPPVFGLP